MGKINKQPKLKIFLSALFFVFSSFLFANSFFDKEKYNNESLNLIDFGAKGDGITDDSDAFIKALKFAEKNNYTVLHLEDNFIYNLNKKRIQLPKRLLLKFSGAIIKNAELVGDNTLISADPVKIFDQVVLSGHYINTDQVYVEWFGTFPNNSDSNDLKTSLEQLNKVFFFHFT